MAKKWAKIGGQNNDVGQVRILRNVQFHLFTKFAKLYYCILLVNQHKQFTTLIFHLIYNTVSRLIEYCSKLIEFGSIQKSSKEMEMWYFICLSNKQNFIQTCEST